MDTDSRLLLFYPTSAVHVRDWQMVFRRLVGWRVLALVYAPQEHFAPGILAALREHGTPTQIIERGYDFDKLLPETASVVVLGAVFEAFGLDLIRWSKIRGTPVAAIEEVAQLGLNQNGINNYDAPFDRLFLASPDEYQRFIALGYPPGMLKVSGLLAYDRLREGIDRENPGLRRSLGILEQQKPIVYTTSPLRSRISVHTIDDAKFRAAILRQVAIASRRTGMPVIIKLHPSEDRAEVRDLLRKAHPEFIVVGREHPMDELFAITGVLLNRGNSQTCLEAILRGVPTVAAACGIRTLFHQAGGTIVVDSFDAIPDAISRALEIARPVADEFKAQHFFHPPQGVASMIASELELLACGIARHGDPGWDRLLRSMLFAGELGMALRLAKELGPGTEWRASVLAAMEAHVSGQHDDAIARWLDCIGCDATWYWPHFELAHAYASGGEHGLAVEHAHQAIRLLPPHYRAWHELPMRRTIMASHRAMGNTTEAAAELASLEERSFVDVLPELLLEKATQQIDFLWDYGSGLVCLEHALAQIDEFPVNRDLDADLRNRVLAKLRTTGERCENERRYPEAAASYSRLTRATPDELWWSFALARVRIAQFRLMDSFSIISALSGLPGVARELSERALPAFRFAALVTLWPNTRGGILGTLRMVGHSYTWFAKSLCRERLDWPNYGAISLLLTLFFLKHLARSLVGQSRHRT